MKKQLICIFTNFMLLGSVFLSGCGTEQTTKKDTPQVTSKTELKNILSNSDVYQKDDSIFFEKQINADMLIRVIVNMEKKDGNYIFEDPISVLRCEIGKQGLITQADIETDNNTFDYSLDKYALANYDNTRNGNSQAMVFAEDNEENNTPLTEVIDDMTQSETSVITYDASIADEKGTMTISQEEAEEMRDVLDSFEKQAKQLSEQKVSVTDMKTYLNEGQESRETEQEEQRVEAKQELADFTKISDEYSTYYIKQFQSVIYTGIKLNEKEGKVTSIMPVMGIMYEDIHITDLSFNTDDERFTFDNDFDDSILDTIESGSEIYNFPLYTLHGLDIYSVLQNMANSSTVTLEFNTEEVSDEQFVDFENPDIFETVYQDLTDYDETFSCLVGEQISEL